ncbi:MAG: hypothetical protein AAB520_01135 [Patescibacteria group bacterium]
MVTIIHGNDPVTSRKFFLDQKDKDSVTFDAEALELSELELSLQGSGLFGSTKKVFIENLFTRKGSKNIETIAKYLESTIDSPVYIWADKELPAKSISPFKKPEIQNFKIPSSIFSFLDGLRPNSQQNLASFHTALSGTEPEIIFFMMIRQFRLLLGIGNESNNNIDEIKRLAPWQKGKLLRQASLFGTNKLKEIYGLIYKIDKSQKTGASNLTLTQDIDILLLEI